MNNPDNLDLQSLEMFPSLGTPQNETKMENKMPWGNFKADAPRRPGVTQVFQLPLSQQRKIQGTPTLAEICINVGRETNTVIEASRSGHSQSYTFVIKGTEFDINTARRRLWSRLAENLTISIDVPKECLGLIIGSSGKHLKELQHETSTFISIPKSYTGHVNISGDFEGIALAKQRIETIISEKVRNAITTLEVKKYLVPFIFEKSITAKASERYQSFSEEYNVRLSATSDSQNDDDSITLNISGDKTFVAPATEVLMNRINVASKCIKSVITPVSKNLHKLLIGSKAETLHSMEEETGCVIIVPSIDDPSNDIIVYGPDAQLMKGLQAVLDRTSSFDVQPIKAHDQVKELYYHKCRSQMREIEKKYEVMILGNDTGFSVEGKKAGVAMAIMELRNNLDSLSKYKFDILSVDASYMKHIIGKKGHSINQFQEEFGVDIMVIESADKIVIAGPDANSVSRAREQLTKKVSELSDFISVELKVDGKFHRQLIGHQGSNIKKYHEKFPHVVIDFGNDIIKLRGPSSEIKLAQSEISQEAERLKHDAIMHSYTTELVLSAELAKVAIDKAGKLVRFLNGLSRDHNVKLTLENSNSGSVIVIQGLKKDADSFRSLLAGKLQEIANRTTEKIEVDHRYHSLLIGKNGRNIQHFIKKYDINLIFPKAEDTDNNTIEMIGPKSNMKAARDEIFEYVEYEISHSHTEIIEIPSEMISILIGKGGSTINSIRLETDAQIDIFETNTEDGTCKVRLSGTRDSVAKAKSHIHDLVTERQSILENFIPASDHQFMSIIKNGEFMLRSLINKYNKEGIHIVVDRPKKGFSIRGKIDNMGQAKEAVENLIKESDSLMMEEVELPRKHHGELIGPEGSNINRLQNQFEVNIIVPSPHSTNPNLIAIAGRSHQIQAVKKELLLFDKTNRIVKVPASLKKNVLSNLKELLVNSPVEVTEFREGLNLKGDKKSCDDIAKEISEIVTKLSENLVIDYAKVPVKARRSIIGRGGSQIQSIREETGCQIYIPSERDNSERVKLCGSKEAVQNAKQLISEILAKTFEG